MKTENFFSNPGNDNGYYQVIEFRSIANELVPSRPRHLSLVDKVIELRSIGQTNPIPDPEPPLAA
jgi:hypothetical protein